ncbi:Uncharacterized protein FWK35_00017834 [Aphis craccivora]|uniref:Uncharacterized protein n=1 Tax=Aphis craccivora TaxID=307492 RepID=A0A6G0Y9F5_APHCR|nr:Uncharacterized protein FWK35_00017834 [Aphis craccivora]
MCKNPLKPKFHILTHYGRLLLKNGPNGPIILTSGIRFEAKAKHSIFKSIANSIPCRTNLGYTLARKLQLQTVNRVLTASGLQLKSVLVKVLPIGLILVIQTNLDDCLFGEIDKILVGQSRVSYFIIKPLVSIGFDFDSHFHAHEGITYINELVYPYPTCAKT